jgi:cytochrome c2
MRHVGITLFVSAAVAMLIATTAVSRAAAPMAPGDPAKGKLLFVREKCHVCHRIGDSGGKVAPDLSNVGTRRNAAWLAKFLPNPQPLDPKNPPKVKMTPPNVKGQELDDLIAYLLT